LIRASTNLAVTFLIGAVLAQTAAAQQPGEISYQDESVMPAGAVGQRIASMIETFNSGDPERIRRFLEEECTPEFKNLAPMEQHLDVFTSVRRQWGSVQFHGIRTYTPPRPDETIVILKDTNYDAWRALTLRFDESSDHRISRLAFNDARTPSNVEEVSLTQENLIDEASHLMGQVCERDVFSGTVLIARGEGVLFTHACGEASKRFHVPNNLETRFNLGSMNKMFTATAIMQLVEREAIALEDPISKYVDESWLPREITDAVTVHHLLTHTSGLGSYFNDTYWNSSRDLYRALDDYKSLIRGEELAFEPGSAFRYSNTGMFLLGVVIESATGQDYFDYVREHIYAPAGMHRSDSFEMDDPVENLAIGYDPVPDSEYGFENNLYKHVIRGGPAGGGFSTVGDLHRFARALVSGGLVSEESTQLMWTDHSGDGYGYGFGIQETASGRVVGHGGGFPGINSNLDIMLDRGYIVAVMSNYGQAASPVARSIAQMIARVPVESS
jgi:CubicO group peptidase (beta-lactamase class C family)